jgi:hypothetical protein
MPLGSNFDLLVAQARTAGSTPGAVDPKAALAGTSGRGRALALTESTPWHEPVDGAPLSVDGGGRGDGFAAARHFWVAIPRRLQRSERAALAD